MTQATFQSLAQAVEIHYGELRQLIQQRTGSTAMADEVVQETWLRASAFSLDMPANPRAYLYRMALNLAVDQLRRSRSRDKHTAVSHKITPDAASALDMLPSADPGPLDVLVAQHEMAALDAAVRELPHRCREVFVLYRGHGLRMKEVAQRLGIAEKTVEKHIARAMLHCRKRLREAGRDG